MSILNEPSESPIVHLGFVVLLFVLFASIRRQPIVHLFRIRVLSHVLGNSNPGRREACSVRHMVILFGIRGGKRVVRYPLGGKLFFRFIRAAPLDIIDHIAPGGFVARFERG
jgi:hypothetical protein